MSRSLARTFRNGGTTVETTIRILSKWQKLGLVATQKHRIILQKAELLAEMV
ncbi:MAG: helix-turn-helix domain-containing protein [Fimbriimonadaceae bacterium]